MSVIKLIGIELEGAWDHEPDAPIHGDGSVMVHGEYDAGEISSPPLRRDQVNGFITRNYPDRVDASCGLHVHTSLVNVGRYAQLMSADFFRHWKSELRKWGGRYPIRAQSPFWSRLNGYNTYCQDEWGPAEQAQATSKWDCRYRMLNFCWTLHGTLEARVLPMFKQSATAIAAVNRHLDIIEDWLSHRRIRSYIGQEKLDYPQDVIALPHERIEETAEPPMNAGAVRLPDYSFRLHDTERHAVEVSMGYEDEY